MPAEMAHVVPLLRARDLDETVDFYTRTLGFLVTNRVPGWCWLLRGAASLQFFSDAVPAAPTLTGAICLYPKDVAAEWDRLKDKVEMARPLARTPHGMREFSFRDPNGYELRYSQEI
jgi:catechol 2,3-dioxygenase-like lactoylglutathione lyase family enzyme